MSEIANLDALSFSELQEACRKAGISTSGNAQKLKQRLRGKYRGDSGATPSKKDSSIDGVAKSDAERAAKRVKPNPLEHLKCKLCNLLPVDPVMAEDGQIYERVEILNWFKRSLGKSPSTNEYMGQKLMECPAIVSTIKAVIESADHISEEQDEMIAGWRDRCAKKLERDATLQRANNGDPLAMEHLGCHFYSGSGGYELDMTKAYYWNEKAAAFGRVKSMTLAGLHVFNGGLVKTIKRDKAMAISLLSMAAHKSGSDVACITLGQCFANGYGDLPQNKAQAYRLLKLGISGKCKWRHASQFYLNQGKELLTRLEPPALPAPVPAPAPAPAPAIPYGFP